MLRLLSSHLLPRPRQVTDENAGAQKKMIIKEQIKRVGIFGGSFDPIHKGHIAIAEGALKAGVADEVWLMVSPENPLKQGRLNASENDRLAMARLSVAELPENIGNRIKVSDFEFKLPRPSYTINTLDRLAESYPQYRFRWIIGGDNLAAIEKWVKPDEIIGRYGLIIYPRPGDEEDELSKIGETVVILKDPVLQNKCEILQNVKLYPHSSTSVRDAIQKGATDEARSAVGDKVMDYIEEKNLYRID